MSLTTSTTSPFIGVAQGDKGLSIHLKGQGSKQYYNFQVRLHVAHPYSSYEAEIQFVHYKSSYNNLTEAVADNQTDSLAIVAVFIAEQSYFGGDNHISSPEAVSELMTQAVALSQEELNTALEMNVTLDQLISNIGYGRYKISMEDIKRHIFFPF